MTDAEILARYRAAVLEIAAIERQAAWYTGIGAPSGYGSPRYDGMPRGTNNPQAAALQHGDSYVALLGQKREALTGIVMLFEAVLDRIADDATRIIARRYYGLGETDAQIAEALGLSQEWINRIRNNLVKKLS